MPNFRKLFKSLIDKFKEKKKILTPNKKEIVLELEIRQKAFDILSKGDYPHLFKYNPDIVYWADFATAICFAESGYDRFKTYMEPAPLFYESIGLMQLSHIDQKNYSFCDIQGDKIFQVENNLFCGIGILNKTVGKYKDPINNFNVYWSVLNTKNKRHKVFLQKFFYLRELKK